MHSKEKALIMLAPAFAADETDNRMPSQELLVRTLNRLYPSLRIIVISFHFPVRIEKEYYWYGNRILTGNGDLKGGFRSPLLWVNIWRQLRQLDKDYELVGIFSFFCSECAFVGHYFAKRHKLKHLIWVLGQDAKKDNHQVKRINPKPEELVTISDFLQEEFTSNHAIRPAYVIPIGLDPAIFPHTPQPRTIDLLGAGSLIPLKQYDQFLDIVNLVKNHIPGLKATLLGNGPEEKKLKDKASVLGLEQTVAFPGKQSHTDTLRVMQQCRIFLHTSSYEGLGVVCLEALYAGAQVISFCKPMHTAIPGWHIVTTKEEMAAKAIALLQIKTWNHEAVIPYRMEDTAQKIMHLFGM